MLLRNLLATDRKIILVHPKSVTYDDDLRTDLTTNLKGGIT